MKNVGKPCAGEPHARFDGRELETEHPDHGHGEEQPNEKPLGPNGSVTYRQGPQPRQLPTLLDRDLVGVVVPDVARPPRDPRLLCRHLKIQRWPWATG